MTDQPMTCEQARDLAPGYVLGALERTEEAAVRRHLATCDQPHPEFAALGGVVPAILEDELADLELVEPPASLRDRISAAAASDLAANPRSAPTASSAASEPPSIVAAPSATPRARPGATASSPSGPNPFPPAAERAARVERRRTGAFDWALRIAAVVAIVAAGAWTLNLQGELDRARAFDQAVTAVVQAAAQPGAKTAVLAQQPNQHGSGIAAVRADGSVVLAMHDLQATSGSQSYTAWVIVGRAAPVNVGDFPVDASGTRAFTTKPVATPEGAVIAVTLEPNAGNPTPTGPIVVAGQAAAPPPPANG
jgi:hypothetical protein